MLPPAKQAMQLSVIRQNDGLDLWYIIFKIDLTLAVITSLLREAHYGQLILKHSKTILKAYLKKLLRWISLPTSLALMGLICLYQQVVSPFLGKRCRFYPSCSHYAKESLKVHGAFKGSWLTGLRLIKCHPLHPGGVDLVPHQRIKE